MTLELGYSSDWCVKLAWVGSQGDRGARVEVHVVSNCSKRDELALLLRPLFRQGVLYIPTKDALEGVGETFALRFALADQSLVLRAQARTVDPFAYGLITGGYPGFAVKLTDLDARGREFVTELTRSFDGTLPFGVPTSALGDRRILCRLQYEEQLEPTVLPVKATAPITEVARAGSTGITGPRISRGGEDSDEREESTTIIGEDTMQSLVDEESTAVADESEPTNVAHTKLLVNDADIEEATVVGPPPGLQGLVPPLPAPATAPATPPPAPAAVAPVTLPAQSAPPLISDGNGNLLPNPLYNGIPSSILLGPGERERPVTNTDFITAATSLNRPLIVASLAAAILGLLTGYLIWGNGDTATPVASKGSDPVAVQPDPVNELLSATPGTATQGTAIPKTEPTPVTTSPAASPCHVTITTSPAGAALFHQGAFVGASPYDGPMPCDATRVDIRHPQYQATEAVFAMQEGKASAQVELARPRFLVTVRSVPGKAIIKRDGDVLGRTPMLIRLPGFESTSLTIARKGFAAQTIDVTPTKYKSAVNLRLARKR